MDTADFYLEEFWRSEWDWYFSHADIKTGAIQNGAKESVQEYLHRGEVIESCARKKMRRRYCVNGDIFQKIFTKKAFEKEGRQKVLYLKAKVADNVIRPVCSDIAKRYLETGVFDAKGFYELFDESLDINICLETEGYGRLLIHSLCRRHQNPDICVVSVLMPNNERAYAPLNDRLTARQHGSGYYLKAHGKNTSRMVVDMGLYFADYAILSMVLKYLKGLPEENRDENRIWGLLKRMAGSNPNAEDISGLLLMKGKLQGGMFHCMAWAQALFLEMMEEYRKDKSRKVFLKELSDRDKVWQTKKNIPDKIVKAMQKSGFNNFFGYVEFDEETDLHSMAEIEKEWNAIASLFHWKKREEVSVRFRKLGNHHATGLYFPALKCLCVDIRSPSSMIHEYFHMLDFEENDLSRGQSFYTCEILYAETLKEYMSGLPETDPQRMQWEGKTKYNRSYYLEPTEIFARCGEMYMTSILKIDNSLCRPQKGFAYPENPELLSEIERYFNRMFQKLHFISKEENEPEETI